jgi:hypothetical protein
MGPDRPNWLFLRGCRVTLLETAASKGVTRRSCRTRIMRSQSGQNFFHPEAKKKCLA